MTGITLFAGAGGADVGLHAAGIRTLARSEWDADACATLRAAAEAGFLDVSDVLEGDVRSVDWSPYAGRCDFLWASPPCQAFSMAGKRLGAKDERNGWPWTFDAIDAIRPTWVACENVPGMLMHQADAHPSERQWAPNVEACAACYFHGHVLPEFRRRFASVQWSVLGAERLGVPQARQRLFVVAGPRPIRWPEETHDDGQLPLFGKREKWVTVGEALGLSGVFGGGTRGHGMAEWRPRDVSATVSATVSAMCSSTAGHYVRSDAPAPTLRANGATDASGHEGGHAGVYVLDAPMPTLSGGSAKSHTNGNSILSASAETRAQFHAAGIRALTVAETAILQDFPRGYPFQGTKTAQYRQVGNACCARVVEAIVKEILASHLPPHGSSVGKRG